MYKVFNMGIGFVVIAKEEEADDIIKELSQDVEAYKIGKVISEDKIKIKTFEDNEIEY
jgi:phosphoribosylformylglycinamidine cyclo-ligase